MVELLAVWDDESSVVGAALDVAAAEVGDGEVRPAGGRGRAEQRDP